MNKQAHFSKQQDHRFWLLRSWDDAPRMVSIIGLNPSTANATDDDATIRSCIRLTRHLGFGGFVMVNLYSFITPYPPQLQKAIAAGNAFSDETDTSIARMVHNTHLTICAWGSWPFINDRKKRVLEMVEKPMCFGCNVDGNPKHPLYLATDTALIPYNY